MIPFSTFTAGELADGLLKVLEYLADKDRWESSVVKLELDRNLVATVEMGNIVGETSGADGRQNRTATA